MALLLVIVSLPAFAQRDWGHGPQPRSGACFYQNEGFGGNYFCMKIGDRWASLPPGFNDHISSIRVFGGARVRVFNDGNFRGISLRLDRDAFNLREIRIPDAPQKSWNDRISSIAVFGDRDEWDDHRDWHDRH
ncbi:MAG: peptidase inhibitor family I36 protein [Acidobacteriota bacterium]|nr:peptidase inhibitor family I36 protein [Acidobacteriota bacterium]